MNHPFSRAFIFLVCLSLAICSCAGFSSKGNSVADGNERDIRAVWVARFHYSSPEDVKKIIQNCADYGFTGKDGERANKAWGEWFEKYLLMRKP